MPTATLDRPDTTAPPAPAPAPERRSRRRLLVGGAALAVLAVEAVLAAPHLGAAAISLTQAADGWVGLAVFATAASVTALALARRRLLAAARIRVRTASTLASILVSNAFHVTLPGGIAFSTGYSYRWMRERGAEAPVAGWVLAVNGLLSTATLAGLGLAASLLDGGAGRLRPAVEVACCAALVLGARRLLRRPETVLPLVRRLSPAVDRLLRCPPDTAADRFAATVAQLGSVRPGRRDWAAATAFALLNWLFDLACLVLCARAVGLAGLTPAVALCAYVAGMAAAGLSLLPGGLGTVDAALVLALVAGGVPAAPALSAVLLYRLVSLVGLVAAGWAVHGAQLLRSRSSTWTGRAVGAL